MSIGKYRREFLQSRKRSRGRRLSDILVYTSLSATDFPPSWVRLIAETASPRSLILDHGDRVVLQRCALDPTTGLQGSFKRHIITITVLKRIKEPTNFPFLEQQRSNNNGLKSVFKKYTQQVGKSFQAAVDVLCRRSEWTVKSRADQNTQCRGFDS